MTDRRPRRSVPDAISVLSRTGVGRALFDLPRRYFHATLEGIGHIPSEGGALLVGNHGMLGIDSVVLGALVFKHTGRYVLFLADRNLWRIPILAEMLTALGARAGEPRAAQQLLEEGALVGVYPGGVDDSLKLSTEKHDLKWGKRAGFARVAMRARVPIVPVVGLGIGDMYDVVAREKWVGRKLFGSPRYDLPIALGLYGTPIPKRAPQRFIVLPKVDTTGDADDEGAVERVRKATYDAIQERLRGT